ncbi:uncharacterized protein AMSG_02307 [Thecamonas trahens ATCC 50062]|uniref:Uncharacterized protein n=1 Tax=Thecamonas trahens ATCC 50062 TaxID=461836 RepID=A0A0L0DVY4_THETB|nr:hypothetical protein AMSG_02307 [Thecamonas trahens ATCC 50062]KNC56337.1 hypothetical protein AMSG_02307 [Thecamonas trahens ATCC 50062]|eukprot:XP_013760854.1 hypothetical protein AMSG_02307 [Thecamonas trahens ATCC 50062]
MAAPGPDRGGSVAVPGVDQHRPNQAVGYGHGIGYGHGLPPQVAYPPPQLGYPSSHLGYPPHGGGYPPHGPPFPAASAPYPYPAYPLPPGPAPAHMLGTAALAQPSSGYSNPHPAAYPSPHPHQSQGGSYAQPGAGQWWGPDPAAAPHVARNRSFNGGSTSTGPALTRSLKGNTHRRAGENAGRSRKNGRGGGRQAPARRRTTGKTLSPHTRKLVSSKPLPSFQTRLQQSQERKEAKLRALAREAERKELEELRVRPRPSRTSAKLARFTKPLNERMDEWARNRDASITRKRNEQRYNERRSLPFRPQIGRKSTGIVARRGAGPVLRRMEQHAKDVNSRTERRRQELIRQREEDIRKNCTFKPTLDGAVLLGYKKPTRADASAALGSPQSATLGSDHGSLRNGSASRASHSARSSRSWLDAEVDEAEDPFLVGDDGEELILQEGDIYQGEDGLFYDHNGNQVELDEEDLIFEDEYEELE